MQLHSSQVQLTSLEEQARAQSALPLPLNYRTNHASSTRSGLPHRKVLPGNRPRHQRSDARRSESTHLNKTNEKTLARFNKLDLTVGEGFGGGNPMKEYKRQTLRGKVRAGLSLKESGLRCFFDRVEEL